MKNQQAIAAGHEVTLEVAKEILLDGGNAFDASIAAAVAMFITEPCMASAGAGGFAMCHKVGEAPVMLDFFAQTPQEKPILEKRDFYPIHVNFGIETETFHVGLASAAVPGTIAGLYTMHRKFGTMPMEVLLQPAMELAKKGVVLNTFQGIDLELLEVIFLVDPTVRDVFFTNDIIKKKGELLQLPHFGSFLDFLKDEGEKGFYRGEISQTVANDSIERGGYLRRHDFENYSAKWRKPLNIPWHDKELYLPNGPSLGGAIMALIFGYLDIFDGDWVKTISKVKNRYQHPREISKRLETLHPELDFHMEGPEVSTKGTSHFNVVDKWGNAVSLTTSMGEGSGYFIPGTDMQLNNMMGESFLLPGGFHSWTPNVRLNSMMTPTLVLDGEGKFRYAGGSGGAGRIPFMIAQVVKALFDEKLSLEEATQKARIHVQERVLHFEKGASPNTEGFEHIKEWDYESLFFGGVHSIFRGNDDHLEAAGDSRRYGVADVF
ncbi:MAG: gamma-glutamyltranspeptidase [Flavobacteriales bacterium]|nr:gamma-glutamyltranspeptidase [Flavobacteriales bacterium]